MMPAPQDPAKAALDWLVRQRDPLFDDWDGFTLWLEADPAHAAHYQRLMALDAVIADDLARSPPVTRTPVERASPPRKVWLRKPFAIVAVVAALITTVTMVVPQPDEYYEVATAAGQRRHILLADGSRVVLNSDTRMRFDRDAPRAVRLERGEALFDVAHDPRTRFRVTFAGGSVENLGTRFTVALTSNGTEVKVAKGAVAYRGGNGKAELHPGQRLVARRGAIALGRVAADRVGAWAAPRLTYDNAALHTVAADLSRELGVPVGVTPAAANRRVTASIQLDLDVERSMVRLGPLLDVRVGRRGDGWLFAPAE